MILCQLSGAFLFYKIVFKIIEIIAVFFAKKKDINTISYICIYIFIAASHPVGRLSEMLPPHTPTFHFTVSKTSYTHYFV